MELALDTMDEPAPDFRYRPDAGPDRSLSSLQGHPVLLHLWATWCASCKAELPDLTRFAATLSGDGVRFVAVAVEDEAARPAVRRFLAALPPSAGPPPEALLVAPSSPDVAPFLTWGLPVTYLLDAHGRVVARALGARSWSAAPGARADVLARLKGGA